jgi:hypothetical protein
LCQYLVITDFRYLFLKCTTASYLDKSIEHSEAPFYIMQSHNVLASYDKEDEIPLTDEESLSTGLIGAPAAGTVPAVKGQSLMQVTAPANLPEGYEFTVMLGSLKFPVKVPPGGVEEGQVFTVPIPTTGIPQIHTTSIPVGAWRDDLDGCFNYGACHPHCWTACACSLCKWIRG